MTLTATASVQPFPSKTAPRPLGDAVDTAPVFVSDGVGHDGLGRADAAGLLAEVLVHRRAETPLSIAVLGPPGSGKSRFLDDIVEAAERLAEGAGASAAESPFLPGVVAARIEAMPGRAAGALLVGGVLDALAVAHAGFAEGAIHAGGDPREAARLAGERVTALRRSLDGERQTLDELSSRRARLTETILFDGAGSRLDTFARANRGRIEARLRAFGLSATDPLRRFKELVVDAAESGGATSRSGLTLRAFWGFKGQGALFALAVVLAALGWAAGWGADNPDAVSSWLGSFGDRFTAITDGARARLDLLQPASRIAFALAALALLADSVRAARFLGPVLRGVRLLKGDLDERRRDLDGLLAHQTRRVDGLAAEAEAASQGADAAQRRFEGHDGAGGGLSDHSSALAGQLFGLGRTPDSAAKDFFAALGSGIAARTQGAPERVIVALDGIERLPAPEAETLLETTRSLLGRPGLALVLALNRDDAVAALGDTDPAGAANRLDRIAQLTYDLATIPPDAAGLAERFLGPHGLRDGGRPAVDASRSALDRAFEPTEVELLRQLAPFAGDTPRAIKRFVNGYRVARADPRLARAAPGSHAMLALSLALDGAGMDGDIAAFDADLASGKVSVDHRSAFSRAFAVAIKAVGQEVGAADLRRGLAVARSYRRRG